MSLHADVRVYAADGSTLVHTIAAEDMLSLSASDEVGGGGGISFSVPTVLLPSAGVLSDCVLKVWIQRATGSAEEMVYAIRAGEHGSVKSVLTIGAETVEASGVPLLQVWGQDAVIRPEYGGPNMPRAAGDERGFGWMGSAYDPGADASEPWDRMFNSSRGTGSLPLLSRPFPTGSGAIWVSCTGDGATYGDRKLARATLTVAARTMYRIWYSSDETSTVWVAGEAVIRTDDVEVGKKETHWADMLLEPGTYAIGVDFVTHVSVGGDGVDPFILAMCELQDDGENGTWVLVSSASTFVGCRRFITGSGSQPPGPTAGSILLQVLGEAVDRGVQSFTYLAADFTAALDSDGAAWATTEERVQRYSFDSYLNLWDGLGDNQCDIRILPDLTLQARVFEGVDATTVRLVHAENVEAESEQTSATRKTVADALTKGGWITRSSGSPRREVALSLGTAPSLAQGERITDQALLDFATPRTDGDIEFIAQPGCEPYVDFRPGDTVTVARAGGDVARRVLTLAMTGGKPLRWSAELGDAFL